MNNNLMDIYLRLKGKYKSQNWWPIILNGQSIYREEFMLRERTQEEILEISIGALLTQNTLWSNAEKAIINLKDAGCLNFENLKKIKTGYLATLIKPSGYYNQKARKIKAYMDFMGINKYNLDGLFVNEARNLLLTVWGIGMETADSILLYAYGKRIFVVDAYAKRIFSRIGLINKNDGYENIREYFQSLLPENISVYREYHALIVKLGKEVCKKKPLCEICCLSKFCMFFSAGQRNAQ